MFTEKKAQLQSKHKRQLDTAVTVLSLIANTADGDLHTFARSININIYQIQFCVKTVTELLDKLHGIGLCHGDLSSQNVIVTRDKQVYPVLK